MKKSKFRRALTVFLVCVGVLAVLFGCLSPLFFQRDERLSASASVPTTPPNVVSGYGSINNSSFFSFGNMTASGYPERNFLALANQANGSGAFSFKIWCQTSSSPGNPDDGIWCYSAVASFNTLNVFYIPSLNIPEQGSGVAEGFNNYVFMTCTFVNPSPSSLSSMYIYYYFAYMEDPEVTYNQGVVAGNEEGYNTGYEEGYNSGLNDNSQYQAGYNQGYSVGLAAGQNTSWGNLNVVTLFLSPVNDFLSTPLFGSFSIGTAFSVVLVVLLATIFIKMFAGG